MLLRLGQRSSLDVPVSVTQLRLKLTTQKEDFHLPLYTAGSPTVALPARGRVPKVSRVLLD